AFEGKTAASTIAAILAGEPPAMSQVQPLSPRALEARVKTCLAKDPDERVQSAHDVKLQLKWIQENALSPGTGAVAAESRKAWHLAGWLVAGLLSLLMVGGAAWWLRGAEAPAALYFN